MKWERSTGDREVGGNDIGGEGASGKGASGKERQEGGKGTEEGAAEEATLVSCSWDGISSPTRLLTRRASFAWAFRTLYSESCKGEFR